MTLRRRTCLGWLAAAGALSCGSQGQETGRAEPDVKVQPPPVRRWPASVFQPEVRVEFSGSEGGGSVFRSENFEYWVETDISSELMNGFARTAEGTRRLWRALPLDLPPEPETSPPALVRIHRDETSYRKAGGPERTAGFFQSQNNGPRGNGGRGVMLVNAGSLGLELFQGRLARGGAYRPGVLIHELSHQATAPWLPFLPLWLKEGLAEYGALIPFQQGRFILEAGALRSALKNRMDLYRSLPADPWEKPAPGARAGPLAPWILPLDVLTDGERNRAGMVSPDWRGPHRIYFTALLYVFFLIHLDRNPSRSGQGDTNPLADLLGSLTACIRHLRGEDGIPLPPEVSTLLPGRRNRLEAGAVFDALSPRLWQGRSAARLEAAMRAALARQQISLS